MCSLCVVSLSLSFPGVSFLSYLSSSVTRFSSISLSLFFLFFPTTSYLYRSCDIHCDLLPFWSILFSYISFFPFFLYLSILLQSFPKPVVSVSEAVQEKGWIRLVMAASMIAVWVSAHVVCNVRTRIDNRKVIEATAVEG